MEKGILSNTYILSLVLHHALLVSEALKKFFTLSPLERCFTTAIDYRGADLSGGRKFGVSTSEDCQKMCQVQFRIFFNA